MTAVNPNAPVTTAASTSSTSDNFKASDTLVDGKYQLDFNDKEGVAYKYRPLLSGSGEAGFKAASGRVESKMTEWVKSHPGADKAAVDAQLKKTLMQEATMQNIMKSSIQKMMSDIENKMKEMAADRFG